MALCFVKTDLQKLVLCYKTFVAYTTEFFNCLCDTYRNSHNYNIGQKSLKLFLVFSKLTHYRYNIVRLLLCILTIYPVRMPFCNCLSVHVRYHYRHYKLEPIVLLKLPISYNNILWSNIPKFYLLCSNYMLHKLTLCSLY